MSCCRLRRCGRNQLTFSPGAQIIFAFHIALFLFFSRAPLIQSVKSKGRRLTFISTLTLRFLPLLPVYLILSLSYSLINLAFLLPTDGNGHAKFGPQSGFMSKFTSVRRRSLRGPTADHAL